MAKLNKASGIEYLSSKGTAQPGKRLKPSCNQICRNKCLEKITQEQRQQLFQTYYALGETSLQWQYIAKNIDRNVPVQRRRQGKRKTDTPYKKRQSNINYFFQINGERIKVCREMFKNTFDISKKNILTALSKTSVDGELIDFDRRGGDRKKKNHL